jgi:hypothetical protein
VSSTVHKVPLARRFVSDLCRVAVGIPLLVGPSRLARDVVVGEGVSIRREQCRDLRASGSAIRETISCPSLPQTSVGRGAITTTPRRTQTKRSHKRNTHHAETPSLAYSCIDLIRVPM